MKTSRIKYGARVTSLNNDIDGVVRDGTVRQVCRDYKGRVISVEVVFDGDTHCTSCRADRIVTSQ